MGWLSLRLATGLPFLGLLLYAYLNWEGWDAAFAADGHRRARPAYLYAIHLTVAALALFEVAPGVGGLLFWAAHALAALTWGLRGDRPNWRRVALMLTVGCAVRGVGTNLYYRDVFRDLPLNAVTLPLAVALLLAGYVLLRRRAGTAGLLDRKDLGAGLGRLPWFLVQAGLLFGFIWVEASGTRLTVVAEPVRAGPGDSGLPAQGTAGKAGRPGPAHSLRPEAVPVRLARSDRDTPGPVVPGTGGGPDPGVLHLYPLQGAAGGAAVRAVLRLGMLGALAAVTLGVAWVVGHRTTPAQPATLRPALDQAIGVKAAVDHVGQTVLKVTDAEEAALGARFVQEVRPFALPPDLAARDADLIWLRRVLQRLVRLGGLRRNLTYRLELLDFPGVNAFALPGGYLFATRGPGEVRSQRGGGGRSAGPRVVPRGPAPLH